MSRGSSSSGRVRASRRRMGPGARAPNSIGVPHNKKRASRNGANPPGSISVSAATRPGRRTARLSARYPPYDVPTR